MPTRLFAIAADKALVDNDPVLKPMLNNQLIDWQGYMRDNPDFLKAEGQYSWDGPNANTVWDIITESKPNVMSSSGSDSFIMDESDIRHFIAEGIENTTGFVRNKFKKLETLIMSFDFEKRYLIFFFS